MKAIKLVKRDRLKVEKRTSIGGKHAPKNKRKRASWKAYRGQGRP